MIGLSQRYSNDYIKLRYNQYQNLVSEKLRTHQKPHDYRYKQGFFIPKQHPEKCINVMETDEPQVICWRSSWEKKFCEFCDSNDRMKRWGSEIVKILYPNPLTKKQSFYIPDYYIEYTDASGREQKYLIEIKPSKEAVMERSGNYYDKLMIAKNYMKWQAAINFGKKRGIKFKVLTEYDLGVGGFND